VQPGEDNPLSLAIVGCRGRGTVAAGNPLSVKNGNLKLVAVADLF